MNLKKLMKAPILFSPRRFYDERGFFSEIFNSKALKSHGVTELFVQTNLSVSKKNVIRGMHFQKNCAKLVTVIEGAIFDVVVDIRQDSPKFGLWQSFELSEENGKCLYIPDGFAHGFGTLTPTAKVLYQVSEFYNPAEEASFYFNDPEVGIDWPILDPILSEKDRKAPYIRNVL